MGKVRLMVKMPHRKYIAGSGSNNLVNDLGFTNLSMSSIQRQDKDVGTILAWLYESQTRPCREKVQDESGGEEFVVAMGTTCFD